MNQVEEEQLRMEIAHIFESGANEIRIFEMVVNFIDSRNGVNKNFVLADVSGSLPSLDDAAKVAVRISEEAIKPPLNAKEQSIFIAGFQECIKWLNVVFSNDH